jgi:glycosyltransferase involved in cell wall biosynthesis
MKIAILGTRGIPNNYGGFEQFAEYLSVILAQRGHNITVYNPHFHPYLKSDFKGVKIKRIYSPEKLLGAAASNYIYDFFCLLDAIVSDYDIIYEAGYASCAYAVGILKFFKGKRIIVTNMDGMEWQRSKWSGIVKRLIKNAETISVRNSDFLIADNEGIQKYFQDTYGVTASLLPYGAEQVEHVEENNLVSYGLKANNYMLVIARIEPENNIEPIINASLKSNCKLPLVVVGGVTTPHAKYLIQKFKDQDVQFIGGIYKKEVLDSLRYFSNCYLHGHSVGGTNPSLLEAMAASSFIIAHSNDFNRSVLDEDACYFKDEDELIFILNNLSTHLEKREAWIANNKNKIKEKYDWCNVTDLHEEFFKSILRS